MNDVKLNGMRELNFNEVEKVSGGFGPLGGLIGGAGVALGTYGNGGSASDIWRSAAIGTLAGFVSPAYGVRSAATIFGGSAIGGWFSGW